MKLKHLIYYLKEKMDKNFVFLFLFMIFIGAIRNLLELIGWFTKSSNYVGYYPTIPSFLDTICYVFLMVVAEGYLLNLFFGGDRKQLRLLVQRGIWLLLGLFVLIPVLNNLFSYHFFYLPNVFSLDFIHPDLYLHYGPFGIHVAFFLVLFVFPFWLRRFYNCSLVKSFFITWLFYITHYLVTYQFMMNFNWGYLRKFNPFYGLVDPVNVYTAGFVIMTLAVYPLFMKDYPKNKREFNQTALIYFILWLVLIFLFFTKLTWMP